MCHHYKNFLDYWPLLPAALSPRKAFRRFLFISGGKIGRKRIQKRKKKNNICGGLLVFSGGLKPPEKEGGMIWHSLCRSENRRK
jgi:hypothetical protein